MRIIIVVLLPAPFGPRNPKISPDSTANEMSFTAVTVPKDFERDLVSTEYNTLIAYLNYKLLSVHKLFHKKFKEPLKQSEYERTLPKVSLIKCRYNN